MRKTRPLSKFLLFFIFNSSKTGNQAPGQISDYTQFVDPLTGQYAHGNEPGYHTVYLYAYAGDLVNRSKSVLYQ